MRTLFISLNVLVVSVLFPLITIAGGNSDSAEIIIFHKNELDMGFIFQTIPEREELRTDFLHNYEEIRMNTGRFRLINRNWNYFNYKQEDWVYMFEGGLFGGRGSVIDSSADRNVIADQDVLGMQGRAAASYNLRYYYDHRNFTLVSLSAWSRFDLYQSKYNGTVIDSNMVSSAYDESSVNTKFRAGINARAGWGMGRLENINHLVTAERLLEKYYPQRIFSNKEINMVKREIGRIKHRRDRKKGHSPAKELDELSRYLNQQMFLEEPVGALSDWQFSEFLPRYDGSRFEFGPFFNYFNYEPDFIYGGYLKFENDKYYVPEWNRLYTVTVSYNKYKDHDWILLESVLGCSYYPGFRSEYGFGIKYVPAIDIRGHGDAGHVSHNVIPYFKYFSQLTPGYRIDFGFSWCITSNDRYILAGPEFSLSLYHSSY
jgi:hypothetical protein